MSDESMDWVERVRDSYHVPPETPRDAMWRQISARLEGEPDSAPGGVIDLAAARDRRRGVHGPALRLAVAAAALVILGIGIGRISVPEGSAPVGPVAERRVPIRGGALGYAASEHLGRTESLLTMMRADARNGRLDSATTGWAKDLLAETRLLLDTRPVTDREVRRLLEDLELVLAQIVGVSTLKQDGSRARAELRLTLQGLESGEVLPRLQAAVQAGA